MIKRLVDVFRDDIPQGLLNIIRWFPIIWQYRPWDSQYGLLLLQQNLADLSTVLEHGREADEDRLPKIAAINRARTILTHLLQDAYVTLAEQRYGPLSGGDWFGSQPSEDRPGWIELTDLRTEEMQAHCLMVYKYAHILEQEEWRELWDILKGNPAIPGSDMRGWWD